MGHKFICRVIYMTVFCNSLQDSIDAFIEIVKYILNVNVEIFKIISNQFLSRISFLYTVEFQLIYPQIISANHSGARYNNLHLVLNNRLYHGILIGANFLYLKDASSVTVLLERFISIVQF